MNCINAWGIRLILPREPLVFCIKESRTLTFRKPLVLQILTQNWRKRVEAFQKDTSAWRRVFVTVLHETLEWKSKCFKSRPKFCTWVYHHIRGFTSLGPQLTSPPLCMFPPLISTGARPFVPCSLSEEHVHEYKRDGNNSKTWESRTRGERGETMFRNKHTLVSLPLSRFTDPLVRRINTNLSRGSPSALRLHRFLLPAPRG